MADLKPVSPGQTLSISAGDYNAMLDAARAHRLRQRQTVDEPSSKLQAGIILVRNATASDRDFLDVLAIDVPLILPTDSLNEWRSRVALSCIEPDSATHAGRYVVLQEPIPAGKMGRAMVIGVTPVNLDVTADTDRFAEVATGVSPSLKTSTTGSARILWKESGTGAKRGVVMLTGEPGGESTYPPAYPIGWHSDQLADVGIYTITDLGGATQAIMEIIGGGGGGGYGPIGTAYTGGGGGASGPIITTLPFRIKLGDQVEVVGLGAGGAGGTISSTTGATGDPTVVSAASLGTVNTVSGGYGGTVGGGIYVSGQGGNIYVPDTPYPQRSNPGFNSQRAGYGPGGRGLRLANHGGGGNGGLSGNGQAGIDGAAFIWSNGTGLVLTPV